jgi:hypothetical protein
VTASCKVALFLAVQMLLGCSHEVAPQRNSSTARDDTGQWVLESYDAKEGYTFLRNGVHYQTHCTGYYLSMDGADEVYYSRPSVNIEESSCSTVLPFLRKPVHLEQGLDTLYYRSSVNSRVKGRFEFTITKAK